MNKNPSVFAVAAAVLLFSAQAVAGPIPFQVTGSELYVEFDDGGALGDYYDYSMESPEWLDEGDSFEFVFGSVFAAALGSGTAELVIQLSTPDPDGLVGDDGEFYIGSFFVVSYVDLDWGGPVQFGYSYGGLSGGRLSLDLWDYEHDVIFGKLTLGGTITNLQSPGTPIAVPEPGLLFLLGSGLIGIAVIRWRPARH